MRHTCTGVCLFACVLAFPADGAEPRPAKFPLSTVQAKECQLAWAKSLDQRIETSNSVGMKLSLIPPGQFTMGSPPDEEWHRDGEVLHRVTLSKAFYIGTTEVTQAQWLALMGENPSFFEDEDLPVETVTWDQAAEFCRKLSDKEGQTYRLATEAEWEYACRAGTETPFHTGPTITPKQANYDGNHKYGNGPKGPFRETTTPGNTFAPNAWGLHDMHGNVWEWCADWYAEYPKGPATDPTGPSEGQRRIMRGGCWINFPAICRSANRASVPPVSWNFHLGFRVVRVVE